jgi:hypothetical protein
MSSDHSCVVVQGKVYCWGGNYYGENGVPSSFDSALQVVPGVEDAVSVAVSNSHTCAFTSSGDVYCWGANGSGQSGPTSAPNGTCDDQDISYDPCQPQPTHIDGIDHVVDLALESGASCALIDDGSVRCWPPDADPLWRWVTQFSGATSITSGATGPCAVLADGGIKCSYAPPTFDNLTQIRGLALSTQYALGEPDFSCALGPNGEVSCSGDDKLGQLGDGDGASASTMSGGMKALVAGDRHACALDANGQAWCWGENTYGAVGTYPLVSFSRAGGTSEPSPRLVEGVPPLVTIGAAGSTTCGFTADDTLWCWGTSGYGILVGGVPVHMPGPWESGGDTCFNALTTIQNAEFTVNGSCTTDADCVAVPLDLSCDHNCDFASVPKTDSQAAITKLDQLESDTCGAANDAGCLSPPVTCPSEPLRAVCIAGSCSIDDPTRTGCTDECACGIQRAAYSNVASCDGYELTVEGSGSCSQCDGPWVYVVIGNAGTSRFDGHATLSFSTLAGGSLDAPPPMDLDLSLGPGELSNAIRVDNASPGGVAATVIAAGDCASTPATAWVTFPTPATSCP